MGASASLLIATTTLESFIPEKREIGDGE